MAWSAGFLGWMLDAFDFTIFFLIMVPISQEFGVPLTLVAGTVTFTLWLRLLGAFGSGWLCDRIGTPFVLPNLAALLGVRSRPSSQSSGRRSSGIPSRPRCG